ncbi:PHP domain-containing protein [Sessilibacter corallicola]|uniref:PHP domain-containing protein n=1 Tax=Sessilibacter corallicola TaxID=2904075 RepID=UPI001E65D682|nr:PHP domain-containing protein [Sessilibacter corallicola]MCE2028949.1 PHP domain-containing protein [Sessilibacter corallicola]
MSICYDLHCHSTCSDGALSPADVVKRAHAQGVQCLAITDHDTFDAYEIARPTAEELDVTLISGVEFSCQWKGKNIHIVGLNVDVQHPVMKAAKCLMNERRLSRAKKIAERLEKLGVENAFAEAEANAAGGQIGRPHFAKYLVEAGYVKNLNQAFKRYLGAGKPGDIKQQWPEFEEVVGWIRQASGVAIIAHPLKYKLTRTKLREMCAHFRSCGGHGIEVISGGHQTPAETKALCDLANRFEFLGSVGSDFHKEGMSWQELGCIGTPNLSCTPVWSSWSSQQ